MAKIDSAPGASPEPCEQPFEPDTDTSVAGEEDPGAALDLGSDDAGGKARTSSTAGLLDTH